MLRFVLMRSRPWLLTGLPASVGIALLLVVLPWHRDSRSLDFRTPIAAPHAGPEDITAAVAYRADALRRARVWEARDPSRAALGRNPDDLNGLLSVDPVTCRFLPQAADGTTNKFRCVLADGEVVKVKYGHTGEIPAEVAATRLLAALGFGADRMYLVPRVRCYGCPAHPFYAMWLLDRLGARDAIGSRLPASWYSEFEWPAVERRYDGAEISVGESEGWAWYELDQIDPAEGAPRRDVDALRIIAAVLAHWDNKAQNQRLACTGPSASGDRCDAPIAFIQDAGATFGPNKVDLDHWKATAVWADPRVCRLSMHSLPYHGSTFPDVQVSEAGRLLILRQLQAIPDEQIVLLFASSRFREFGAGGRQSDPQAWADAFRDKVRQVASAGPCPA